ncbi:hypothetical protein [Synechococcus phage Ssp-JY37]
MAENDTQKMLKAILLMQVEILGRLERLENAEEYEKQEAEKLRCKLLEKQAPERETPQLAALIEAEAITMNSDWAKIERMLESFVQNTGHDGRSS